jgi:phosphatidate cytidylyltransferase
MSAAPLSNLQLRIASAVVLGAVVLVLTWFGGLPFRLLAIAMGAGVYVEWRKITGISNTRLLARAAELLFILSLAAILAKLPPHLVFSIICVAALVGIVAAIAGHSTKWLPIGILYAAIPAASLAILRGHGFHGLFMVLFLFALVWSTDIFAYFVGRSLGGAKLAPRISPNKTWSGAIGGTAAAVAAGLGIAALAGPVGNPILPIAIVVISIVAQVGDLFESWIKRLFGVKDSGTLIPGHGGVMDRVDGLAVAAVALYLVEVIGNAF